MSFPVTWRPPPVSYSLVGSQMHQRWVVGPLLPLTGDFWSNDVTSRLLSVTWDHETSFPVTWLLPPAGYSFVQTQRTKDASLRPSTTTPRWLPVKLRNFWSPVIMCDVISCHVTASFCKLQPCRKSNATKIKVFVLLQPLLNDFLSNDVTFGSLPVSWGLVTSFPVTWAPPPASYSLVGSQMRQMWLWPSIATSRWLPVKWHHFWVFAGHLRSLDVVSCHVTASSCELSLVGSQMHQRCEFLAFYSHFQVTSGKMTSLSGHFMSPDVTWLSCELQPCRKSNAWKTPLFGPLQPHAGDFQSNDVTSGSFPITWGHMMSFNVTWLPPPVSYSLVGSQTHQRSESNDVTSGSLPITWGHVTSFPVTWLTPASYSLVGIQTPKTTALGLLQPLPGDFRSNDVIFRVTSHHLRSRVMLSRDCLLLRGTLVGS